MSKTQEQQAVSIRFTTPGVVAIGPYQNGMTYRVDAEEAERLIAVKGFERVTDAPITTDVTHEE